MNSRERMRLTLNHKEPDQVPFDLGGSLVTGITDQAYENLLKYLGIQKDSITIADIAYATTDPHEDVLRKLGVDVLGVYPPDFTEHTLSVKEDNGIRSFIDAWGIEWKRPLSSPFFDMIGHPLADVDYKNLKSYPFPDNLDKKRLNAIGQKAKDIRKKDDKYVMTGACMYEPGLFQACEFLLGFEETYIKLASEPEYMDMLLDILLEKDIEGWKYLLKHGGDNFDVILYTDDFGSQSTLIISQEMIRQFFLPRYKKLFSEARKICPDMKIMFHCCGAIFDIIPIFIEMGVDILNPIQVSCKGMDIQKIKKTYGNALVFWGGGIDTHRVLPFGTKKEVEDAVKYSIDVLAPGGGFVFNTVHSIQPEVPPQNIITMIETLQKYGKY
jgi:uroporphyrinogen decarboxylase